MSKLTQKDIKSYTTANRCLGVKRGVKGKSQYHSSAHPWQRNIVRLVKVNLQAFYTWAIRLRTGFLTKILYALITSSIVLSSLCSTSVSMQKVPVWREAVHFVTIKQTTQIIIII